MDPRNTERLKQRDFDLVFEGVSLRAVEEQDADGVTRKYLNGTASSTAKDLYGDVLTASAQVKMLEKLKGLAEKLAAQNSGMTAWLNHSYKIPEDTLGAFVAASLATREDNGETFIDLDIKCRVTETNPRALAAFGQVKDGIRHGWSIGAYFTEWEWMSDDPDSDDYWSMLVTDVELLEVSLVGIPANQRAWCRSTEDLKARTVAAAERIAKDARDATPMQRRELVTKSLFAREELRSAPEPAKREGEVPAVDAPVATEQPASDPPAPEAAPEEQPAQAAAALDGVADTTTTAPLAAREVDPPPETRSEKLAEAANLIAKARECLGLEGDFSDLAAALRETKSTDAVMSTLHAQAADAISCMSMLVELQAQLAKRDPADGDGGTPDDDRDKIGLAIGHLAKSVAHGLCARSGVHVAKAIECLAAGIVDQPGPVGDEEQETAAATLAAENDQRKREAEDLAAKVSEAHAQLEAKAAELATLEASIAEKTAALTEATAQAEVAQKKLKEIDDTIRERGETRLGRRATASEMLAAATDTLVKPEHYAKSHQEQQEALRRMAAGEPAQPSGRDLVA